MHLETTLGYHLKDSLKPIMIHFLVEKKAIIIAQCLGARHPIPASCCRFVLYVYMYVCMYVCMLVTL